VSKIGCRSKLPVLHHVELTASICGAANPGCSRL
jgi:hypothetical protein